VHRLLPIVALASLFCACGTSSPVAGVGSPSPPSSSANAVPAQTSNGPAFAHGTVTIEAAVGAVKLNVDIADDEAKREYGLMNRSSMPADSGMLFVFQPPADAKLVGFWMKDTLMPLSIAFIEPDLVIESLQDMQPLSEAVHYAPRNYAYAIEANQGFFASRGVAVGNQVAIER